MNYDHLKCKDEEPQCESVVEKATEVIKMQVNNSVLCEFLCSQCNRMMHPPIKICKLGHNFCNYCDSKNKNCPYSDCHKGEARNILLENLYNYFTFPCRNQKRGCEFLGKGPEIKNHQKICQYTLVKCPLKIFDCDWYGTRSDILAHVENDHADNLLELDRSSSIIIGMNLIPSTFIRSIIIAGSELFLFTWCLNSDCTTMKWQIVSLGTSGEENFQYNIELYDPLESLTLLNNHVKAHSNNSKAYIEFTDEKSFEKFIHFELVRCRVSIKKKDIVN
ncbi:hypothetical protein FQR65_LT00074 [Abscondita terminalis]|nr:hypothetical protein FQR65_LT00074 [Abscondita terminalis]